MLASQVPGKFNIPFANAAGVGYIRTIPEASQQGLQEGAASLTDGFPPANFVPVGAGGIPPFGQDMNGILKQITQWSQWQAMNGPVIYDATFAAAIGGYPKGTVLNSVDLNSFWRCTVDNNTSNPDAGGAGWIGFKLPNNLYEVDISSTPNSIIIAPTPPIRAIAEPLVYLIKVANANSGPTTLSIFGFSPVTVTDKSGAATVPGAMLAGGVYLFVYDGTKFQILNPEGSAGSLPGLVAPKFYYVNGTTGSDSNDGLAPTVGGGHGPFATIQKALDQLPLFNMNGFNVTISIADGTYNQNTSLTAPPLNGVGYVVIVGNDANPQNLSIVGISRSAFTITGGRYLISGVTLRVSGAPSGGDPGDGLLVFGNSTEVTISKFWMGACSRAHLTVTGGASLSVGAGTVTLTGGAGYHVFADQGSRFLASSIVADRPDYVITTPMTFGGSFIFAGTAGSTFLYIKSMTGAGFVTGVRYGVILNGIISTPSGAGGPNYYPGTVAGTSSNGGQYL